MPDVSPSLPAGLARPAAPDGRHAAQRLRRALDRGCPREHALADLEAYLVVLRPGLPRVLAREQAEALLVAISRLPRSPSP